VAPGGRTSVDVQEGFDAAITPHSVSVRYLVTHGHRDEVLRRAAAARPGLRIQTNSSVARRRDGVGTQVAVVGDGDAFSSAGIDLQSTGPGARSSTRVSRSFPVRSSGTSSPADLHAPPYAE
jgi:hypothetical protein